jgi:hypothetical protein
MRNLLFVVGINSLCRRSAEREAISLHCRIEKLDLAQSIGDRLGLPDQLVQPLLPRPDPASSFVDVGWLSQLG